MTNQRRFFKLVPVHQIFDQFHEALGRNPAEEGQAHVTLDPPHPPPQPRSWHPAAGHAGWPPVRDDEGCGRVEQEYGRPCQVVPSAPLQLPGLPDGARSCSRKSNPTRGDFSAYLSIDRNACAWAGHRVKFARHCAVGLETLDLQCAS